MEENPMGEIVVTLSSTEKHYPLSRLSLTFESTDEEIMDALAPVLLEDEGFNIKEEIDGEYFTIKRVEDSQRIFVFPKSVAGNVL